VQILERINTQARPNKSIVWMTDEILQRHMKLYKAAFELIWLQN
jgi:hypothetical protein